MMKDFKKKDSAGGEAVGQKHEGKETAAELLPEAET